MKGRLSNFIDLCLESMDDDIENIKEELDDEGIDYTATQEDILQMIKKEKAELKIERGRKLKEKVEELKKNLFTGERSYTVNEALQAAYRNLDGITEEDIREIESDSFLLEEIDKIIDDDGI